MIRFQHIRECDEDGNLLNNGGATIAYTVSPEMETIFVHLALCSRKDRFVKKTGREFAADRLKNNKDGPLDFIELSHPYSEAVRLWFMQYFDVGLVRQGRLFMTDWYLSQDEIADAEFELEEPPLIKEEDYRAENI